MKNIDWGLLEKICAIHAVSGREDAMTAFTRDFIQPLVDEVTVDRLGNVVGILRGSKYPDFKLMLQSHMDELGLIIRNITEDGFLLIERVGGVPEKSLLGQRVDVLTDGGRLIPGYVGTRSHHITPPEEKYKVPRVHDMFIDLGLKDRQAVVESGIQVGDPATYHPNYQELGDGMICSKALDNRVGVFILFEILKSFSQSRPEATMIFSFTVLEEFSIRGSLPTVTATNPDAILSIDITIATDTPGDPPLHPVQMRKGPAIKMMDFHGRGTLGGMFSSPKLRRLIESIAGQEHIPLQREVLVGVITDPAFQLYLGEQGYIIAAISVPHRYSHASIQMCHKVDIEQTIQLVQSVASSLNPKVDLSRG